MSERIRAVEIIDLARRHGCEDLACQSIAAGESPAQFRGRLLSHLATVDMGGRFSFRRLVDGMAGESLDGLELEVLQEAARAAKVPFDRQRVFLPWAIFQRDLTTGTAGAGGYLVATEVNEAADVLRPYSVTTRSGVTVLERLVGDQLVPRTTLKTSPHWLTTEVSTITPSTPSLAQIALTPKTSGAFVQFSRQLERQGNAELWTRRELLRTVGTALDQGVIAGSGAAGQPLGLTNSPGIDTVAGAGLAHDDILAMQAATANANASDEEVAWLGTPDVRKVLAAREKVTGSGKFLWESDEIEARPARVSTDVPADTLIAGDWSQIVLGLWGTGFVFEVNPYDPTGFKTGIIQARVLVSCDVALVHPSAFSIATGVS